jgi:hypothetical protein
MLGSKGTPLQLGAHGNHSNQPRTLSALPNLGGVQGSLYPFSLCLLTSRYAGNPSRLVCITGLVSLALPFPVAAHD